MPSLAVVRVAALVALAASAALLSDYTADAPTFCSAASGCAVVRAHQLSHLNVAGVFLPLPFFGVVGFAALFGASLKSRPLTVLLAAIGGLTGLMLLCVQAFVIRRFCWLCVTTDVSAIVAAVAALTASFRGAPAPERLRPGAWWGLGLLSLGAPLIWPLVKLGPAVPGSVQARYVGGKINVVEFVDFECPACRRFSGILKAELRPYGERVHFVRLNKPLDIHPFARDAARGFVCAEKQGRSEPMADALFAAEDLSPAAIERIATGVGLDVERFKACIVDPATDARIEAESSLLVPPELEGLPTTYIGSKRLLGVQSAEMVADALERAARGEGQRGLSGYVYASLVALALLAIVRFGVTRR
jgi:predicted DsbA family dithiol-disulfide isomerase/uncharacterized membrane protein